MIIMRMKLYYFPTIEKLSPLNENFSIVGNHILWFFQTDIFHWKLFVCC